jgi:hypothetical protein
MTFFDRKEEVVDIELTQYGKQLLSLGKFKPVYYQFFDDDIIYDNEYAGLENELQKDIQTRIKETPRTHVQYTFVSPEEQLKFSKSNSRNLNRGIGSFSDLYVPFNLKHKLMSAPLAHAQPGQQNSPAWKITSLRGIFEDTVTYITSSYYNVKIPRLTLEDVEFKIATSMDKSGIMYAPGDVSDTLSEVSTNASSDLNALSSRFKDNSFIQVQDDYILLDLQELNCDFNQENFEVEIYEIMPNFSILGGPSATNPLIGQTLKQLYFNKKMPNVVNNILLDGERKTSDFNPNMQDMVEPLFIIQSDREINSQVLCKNLSDSDKQILVATNQIDLNCEELYGKLTDPRITSDVKPEDLVEKC